MRHVLVLLTLVLCALAAASSALAAPADLDRSFGGGDGIAEVTGPAGSLPQEAGARMAIGPREEIFVLYSNYPASCDPPFECQLSLTVERFSTDGTADPGFGPGPQLVLRQTAYNHYFDIAVGADGKPVIAAYGGEGGGLVVARLGLDGRLDPSFGVGGVTPFASDRPIETVRDYPRVAVQTDGKIVVAASSQAYREEGQSTLRVARFLANGEFDPGFGSGGEASVAVPSQSRPAGVFLGSGGQVTVPGPLCCRGGTEDFGQGASIARFTTAGQLDPAWALDGTLFMSSPGAESEVEAATLAGDSLYLSLEASTPAVSQIGDLVKLAPNGDLDPGFGNGGRVRLFKRVGSLSPADLAVDGNGRLVGVGWEGRIAAFRLRPDGSRDRTFNGGQQIVLPYGGGGTNEYMVGIQASGRIVVLGDSGAGPAKRFGLIALRGGSDLTRCQGKRATIVGTAKKDKLLGTPRRDVIAALGGADEVRGLAGPDLICGGKGRDKLFGGAGKDKVRQ